ncbi:MAG: TolC family protein [Planctomycetota bacterium]
MPSLSTYASTGLACVVLAGCAATRSETTPLTETSAPSHEKSAIVQTVSWKPTHPTVESLPLPQSADEEPVIVLSAAEASTDAAGPVGLPELIGLTLERNPRLAQVGWVVEATRGQAVQAGLYPNPTVSVTGNELGDRTGPSGIWSAYVGQELVTANKLELSQAAALKKVDQESLNVMAQRYLVFTDVRQAFFEALTLQRRADILSDLVALAEQSVANANKLVKAKEAAELDVVQLEVDLERYRADLEATQRALPGAYRKLAASIGNEDMQISRLAGDLTTALPGYDLEQVRGYMLSIHPELRAAQVGVEQAQLVLRRAEVEPIPNITVGTGYTYQGQNRSSDWDIGFSLPVPVWNRNEGNIQTAEAEVQAAIRQVSRVENDLVNRLSAAFSDYASARERSERYQTAILPRAQRTFELSRKAYQGGQFEYLRVLQAQRAVAEANLELIRSLGQMWDSASVIAGLMLEDEWPLAPEPPAIPAPEPSTTPEGDSP